MKINRIVDRSQDLEFMRQALELAAEGAAQGEVPVGAVVVCDGEVVGRGFNQPISLNDPSAHAEMLAVRQAAVSLANYRLPNATLYVTLEPCSMCAGMLVHARIGRLVFAAAEPRAGAVVSRMQLLDSHWLNHRVLVEGGLLATEAKAMLQQFFQERRRAGS